MDEYDMQYGLGEEIVKGQYPGENKDNSQLKRKGNKRFVGDWFISDIMYN